MHHIPFNRPFIVGKELFYIAQAVLENNISGDGRFTRSCNQWMEERFSAKKVLLTTSCTAALEMAAILFDIQPQDEVIMPSFTFVSTANAFVLRGANIRFVDIRSDTLNIDETLIEQALSPKTKAIVPVHYAGVGCEMDAIMDTAKNHGIFVVEDAAQGVNSCYKEKYLGTIGHLGAYSFHETKNFICGEGGALVVNDESFVERAEIIREKGTNRSKFFRGEVDKYTWVDIGSSYLPSEILAAFLLAQLEEAETITEKRLKIYQHYYTSLAPLENKGYIRLPYCGDECMHNAHIFYFIVNTKKEDRDRLIRYLKEKKINTVFHYVPLHDSVMGRKMGYSPGDFPATESISERIIRLPCYFELSEKEQDRVIAGIFDFFANKI